MATHSSVLAWRIPGVEEPGGLPSMWSPRVGHDWSDLACMHALEKEMATHSSILAWRIPGMEEPGGLPSVGSQRVRHDWSNLTAAAAEAAAFFSPLSFKDFFNSRRVPNLDKFRCGNKTHVLTIWERWMNLLRYEVSQNISNYFSNIIGLAKTKWFSRRISPFNIQMSSREM